MSPCWASIAITRCGWSPEVESGLAPILQPLLVLHPSQPYPSRMLLLRWLLPLLAACSLAQAGGITFERVWPGYRTEASFTRISEYFGGAEHHPGQTILRSHPGERAGYYWLVRTRAEHAQPDARFVLEIIAVNATAPTRYEFPAGVPAGSHPTLLGLTGEDWPHPDHRPTAWRLRLVDAAGNALLSQQSFLWRQDR